MRTTELFFQTLRQVSAEAELPGHRLLLRGGFIRQLAAGIYSFLPLGFRVLKRVEAIIREEMERAGAQEVLLPALHPEELWQRTGRVEKMGQELMRVVDRSERLFFLGPTHEEVITEVVAGSVRSYRQLPVTLFQIQVKFRDEPRPRGGLIRAREFIMKDAYSFDREEAGLNAVYERMVAAYDRAITRCGLPYRVVEAAAGAIGGSDTREFMLVSEVGEDTMLLCSACDYGATPEQAEFAAAPTQSRDESSLQTVERVATPGMKTVEQVTGFLGVAPAELVKTLIYTADGRTIAALVRGDRELNEARLRRAVGATALAMAGQQLIQTVTGAPVGFAGPVGLKDVMIVADEELRGSRDFVTGGNAADLHLRNVNWGRDFPVDTWAVLRNAAAGDGCPRCGAGLAEARGIELAHVFKLGTVYSEALGASFTADSGEARPIIMGCYGFGVSRMVAAVAEQCHDENGLIWPREVAPFDVIVIVVNGEEEAQRAAGESIYQALQASGVEALLEDRPERAGVKFKDADLIGVPVQVVVGRRAAEGMVEVRRRGEAAETVTIAAATARAAAMARGVE